MDYSSVHSVSILPKKWTFYRFEDSEVTWDNFHDIFFWKFSGQYKDNVIVRTIKSP